MTPATLRRRPVRRRDARSEQPSGRGSAQMPTLERLVVSAWDRLIARDEVQCLVCGGAMEPSYAAHATPVGGRCRDCGTTLN